MIRTTTFVISTSGFTDIHNITPQMHSFVNKVGSSHGILNVFVPGSTAGITTIEFEEGAIADLRRAIERIAPQHIEYEHDRRWGDGNGFAHVRAAIIGPSLSIPVADGKLSLGTWQQVILIDFDNRPRERTIILHWTGEQE